MVHPPLPCPPKPQLTQAHFHCFFGIACGDVVKKPKLDQHRARCHGGFDCIDCSTTFHTPGEYKGHTQCISEAEKYQKALYKGPKIAQQQQNQKTVAPPPRNNYPPLAPSAPPPAQGGGGYGRQGWGRPPRVSATGANDTPLGTPKNTPLGTPKNMSPPAQTPAPPAPKPAPSAPAPVEHKPVEQKKKKEKEKARKSDVVATVSPCTVPLITRY
ncbi:hypothetical protein PLICRDRAFT_479012 [Plicaturopsis crispa FD-325 SS-3]|nr:hypothetical protein PLICRDRAFT_479012 [Plicaturopsis crispa FD-325 SS-3]